MIVKTWQTMFTSWLMWSSRRIPAYCRGKTVFKNRLGGEKRLSFDEFCLTELSSSFCWVCLSSKSCSSVSVRLLTAGGAARTPARGLEVGREEVLEVQG